MISKYTSYESPIAFGNNNDSSISLDENSDLQPINLPLKTTDSLQAINIVPAQPDSLSDPEN